MSTHKWKMVCGHSFQNVNNTKIPSIQRQLELARKLQEFEALQQTVQGLEDEIAAIPSEIREKYKTKTERKDMIIRE